MLSTEAILTLLTNRAENLRQRCNASINNLGTVREETENKEQRRIRNAAQSDFNAAEELDDLVKKIQES